MCEAPLLFHQTSGFKQTLIFVRKHFGCLHCYKHNVHLVSYESVDDNRYLQRMLAFSGGVGGGVEHFRQKSQLGCTNGSRVLDYAHVVWRVQES